MSETPDMENAIEKAARVVDRILSADPQISHEMYGDEPDRIARALADAGYLAPALLREEWGSEMRHPIPGRPPQTIHAQHRDNAVWQIEHNPEYATGRIMHRYCTDWTPVDRAEVESWYDAEPDAMPDAGWEPIVPVDRAEGDGSAGCGCAYCHTGPFPIMHVCADCGSKRCPRANHHANPCGGSADQ